MMTVKNKGEKRGERTCASYIDINVPVKFDKVVVIVF